MNRQFIFALLFVVSAGTAAAQPPADGTLIENTPCPPNTTQSYEQYVQSAKQFFAEEAEAARRERFTMTIPENAVELLPDRKTFARAAAYAGFECRQIKYWSDGLRVAGFLWKPKNVSGAPRPLVIYNRGGNRDFGAVSPWSWFGFLPFLEKGFVVLASQYRGNAGGEGREEFGGSDVHDVLNLLPLAKSLGYVDMNNIFLLGASRGGMMTYLALKEGMKVNAAATIGGLADVVASSKERPELAEHVYKELMPGYDTHPEEVMRQRSAVNWPERINVPLLILHGGADWRADPASQALALARRLQEQHKTYQLIIYAEDNHGLLFNRLDSEKRIIDWFKRYTRTSR